MLQIRIETELVKLVKVDSLTCSNFHSPCSVSQLGTSQLKRIQLGSSQGSEVLTLLRTQTSPTPLLVPEALLDPSLKGSLDS